VRRVMRKIAYLLVAVVAAPVAICGLGAAVIEAVHYLDELPSTEQSHEVDGLSVVIEVETPIDRPRGKRYLTIKYRGGVVCEHEWVGSGDFPPANLKIVVDEAIDLACVYNADWPDCNNNYHVIVHLPSRTFWMRGMDADRARLDVWRQRYSLLAARHPQLPVCERLRPVAP
jgi:hypothetical protein